MSIFHFSISVITLIFVNAATSNPVGLYVTLKKLNPLHFYTVYGRSRQFRFAHHQPAILFASLA